MDCEKCSGEGSFFVEEDGMFFRTSCTNCNGSGKVFSDEEKRSILEQLQEVVVEQQITTDDDFPF